MRRPAVLALALALFSCGDPAAPEGLEPSAPPYDLAAIAEVETGRRDELLADLRRALGVLARSPDDASAHLAAGRALLLLDRYEGARWHLERAREGPAVAAMALYQLGVLALRESRPADAVASFEASIEAAPGFAPAHRDLGRALVELGREAEALAPLERAVELDPADADAAVLLARAVETEDAERGARLLEAAVAAAPYHLSAHANLASLYRRLGREEDAERLRARHRELAVLADLGQLERPEEPDRYLAEGRHYGRHGLWQKAAEVVAAGLERHPRHAELLFLAGMVRARAEGPDAAQEAYLRSLELRPGDRRVLEELAALHLLPAPPEGTDAVRAALAGAADRWPNEERFREALARLEGR